MDGAGAGGSAGGDLDHSIEIVGFGATVSRKTKLTEKDLAKDLAMGAAKDVAMTAQQRTRLSYSRGGW